jgi:uncharacterized membrane protein YhaH (DUF805 family)
VLELMTQVRGAAIERESGETKYPLRKMVRFALNGLTSFSFVPLQLATYMGFAVSALSLVYMVYAIGLKPLTDRVVLGWTSMIVAVLFIGASNSLAWALSASTLGGFMRR